MSASGRVRIGELSRRTGVSVDVLRVWERRYGLLSPERSAGGQRLYSTGDEERIRAMLAPPRERGPAAAEAARLVTRERAARRPAPGRRAGPAAGRPRSTRSTSRARTPRSTGCSPSSASSRALDRRRHALPARARRALGVRRRSRVADEHFASRLLHARLLGAARGWDDGQRPARAARLPAGRGARPAADLVRHRAPPARLADHLPGREHPGRRDRRDGREPRRRRGRAVGHHARALRRRARPS